MEEAIAIFRFMEMSINKRIETLQRLVDEDDDICSINSVTSDFIGDLIEMLEKIKK